MSREQIGEGLSFTDPQVSQCPYPHYEALRDATPVYRDPVSGHYVLTRYADVRAALLNPKVFSSSTGVAGARKSQFMTEYVAANGWPMVDALMQTDPPTHTDHRGIVAKALAAPAVAALEPKIEGIVDRFVDNVVGRGEVDFFAAYALPLPLGITAELVGFSAADTAKLRDWTLMLVELTSAGVASDRELPLAQNYVEMQHFFMRNIERVKAHPDDTILGRLVRAAEEDRISIPVVLTILSALISAGHDTTANALTSGMKRLIEDPGLAGRLRADPSGIPTFIEEMLRADSPIQTLFRRTTQDFEVGGVLIPKGSMVEARYGAANRDPSTFVCPASLDVDRENVRSHLAFGAGPHVCIGNQLARAELRLSFEQILRRSTTMRFTRGADSYAFEPGYVIYGFSKLWCEIA